MYAPPNNKLNNNCELQKMGSNDGSEGIDGNEGIVKLRLYDFAKGIISWTNNLMKNFQTGIFHASIEVYDQEFTFYSSHGIVVTQPGQTKYPFRESIELGKTNLSKEEVLDLVDNLSQEWTSDTYKILSKNCISFAEIFCQHLGVNPIPNFVKSAQNSVSTLFNSSERVLHTKLTSLRKNGYYAAKQGVQVMKMGLSHIEDAAKKVFGEEGVAHTQTTNIVMGINE